MTEVDQRVDEVYPGWEVYTRGGLPGPGTTYPGVHPSSCTTLGTPLLHTAVTTPTSLDQPEPALSTLDQPGPALSTLDQPWLPRTSWTSLSPL